MFLFSISHFSLGLKSRSSKRVQIKRKNKKWKRCMKNEIKIRIKKESVRLSGIKQEN